MYVIVIGPWEGDYGLPDIAGPFATLQEAAEWREDAIGRFGWDDHREQIDVVTLIDPSAYPLTED